MSHPYRDIPAVQRWSQAMANRPADEIDPVKAPPFRIGKLTRVATGGSCFAQHISRYLKMRGLPCMDMEPAHPLLTEDMAREFNYGIYTARYGNIYTARQLLQLWRRANGSFIPRDDIWTQQGAYFDPFRPTIQPHGFSSIEEYWADRDRHFAAVRHAFGSMEIMIFTLGLTECWASREDGAVYPLCPGVAAGEFDEDRHVFVNLTLDEIVEDLRTFVKEVRSANPGMRLILTVSPVPLAATAEKKHVLQASTYSKSVLRVAAEEVSRIPGVYYFPSYEIITLAGERYFASDRRSILEDGVERVMSLFFRHVVGDVSPDLVRPPLQDDFLERGRGIVDALCDEQRLDPSVAVAQTSIPSRSMRMNANSSLVDVRDRAQAFIQHRQFDEAIELLVQACRQQPGVGYEQMLAQCRLEAFISDPPQFIPKEPVQKDGKDPFGNIEGIPEVMAGDLNTAIATAAIRHHGALLVRGLLPEAKAMQLASGVRMALDACAVWRSDPAELQDSSWYSRIPLPDEVVQPGEREWLEADGWGVWTADSPRMLFELTELFKSAGITNLVAEYFGERPMMSVKKSVLRCVPPTIKVADWHQDGAFMGRDIRSMNVWLSLSHCGHDASGLECVPQRLTEIVPTGSHGAHLSWSVGPGMVDILTEGRSTAHPIFAPGDALIFDHLFLHRTSIPAAIAKDRYAIESWFFASTGYPAGQVPLWL